MHLWTQTFAKRSTQPSYLNEDGWAPHCTLPRHSVAATCITVTKGCTSKLDHCANKSAQTYFFVPDQLAKEIGWSWEYTFHHISKAEVEVEVYILLVGSQTNLLAYDVHMNSDLFYKWSKYLNTVFTMQCVGSPWHLWVIIAPFRGLIAKEKTCFGR